MKLLYLLFAITICHAKSIERELLKEFLNVIQEEQKATHKRGESALCTFESKVTEEEKVAILKEHNRFRTEANATNMYKMEWDDNLAKTAQEATEECEVKHQLRVDCDDKQTGQNLAASSRPPANLTTFVTGWGNERKNYDITTRTCSGACGHYKQIVWSSTNRVGCGVNECGGGRFFMCNYMAPGNVYNNIPYSPSTDETPPCGRCDRRYYESGWKCENNLCVPCDLKSDGCNNCEQNCDELVNSDQQVGWYCGAMEATYGFCKRSSIHNWRAQTYCAKYCCEKISPSCN